MGFGGQVKPKSIITDLRIHKSIPALAGALIGANLLNIKMLHLKVLRFEKLAQDSGILLSVKA